MSQIGGRACAARATAAGMMRTTMAASGKALDDDATRFEDVLVARTIRTIEEAGPLEDAQALRDAAKRAPTRERQVIERARVLGRRIGLLADLKRLAAISRLVALACGLGVAFLTWVLVATVLGEGRRINVVMAWIGVLGPHFVSLLVWVVAVLAPRSSGIAGLLSRGLGGLALRAAGRPSWAGSHAPALTREGTEMVREAGLLPWAFGVINHGIWAVSFGVLLVVLSLAFAFHAYQLTWESTILSQAFFVEFIGATGRPAELLRLPGADVRTLTPGDASANPQLAIWLMYCVLLYGLLPRLLLALWSRWKWARAKDTVRIDFTDPYYRRLFHRLDQLAEPVIVDRERAHEDASPAATTFRREVALGPPVWIAFELPPDLPWHPGADAAIERVAGDSRGRQRVIDRLAGAPAARVIVVCNGASSPDRGTARFLRDTSAHAAALALWLVGPPGDKPPDVTVWTAWLQDLGFGHLPVFTQPAAARDWGASPA